jgi:drug/metabolite transporter (DMT)-like permease
LIGKNARLLPILAGLSAALIWGVWFPVTRIGISENIITPADMVLLRGGVGAIVFAPLVFRFGMKAGSAGWGGTAAILLTMSGPFAFAIGMGSNIAPAAHAAIFTPGVYPALVFLLALIVLRDPSTTRRWVGLVAILIGAVLAAWAAFEAVGPGNFYGYIWFHACAWFWAVYTLVVRISGLTPAHALGITHLGAILVYGPIWLILGDTGLYEMKAEQLIFQIGYHGVLNGVIAMFFYNYAIQRLGAAEGAVFAALVPSVAAVSAWAILGEQIGWREVAALVIVGSGVFLLSGARRAAP